MELRVRDRGLSLVELMVAMVISLVLLAGVMQIYLYSKKNYLIQDSLARLQENGRYAMDLLSRDLRLAGYFGGNADTGAFIIGEEVPTFTCPDGQNWGKMMEQTVFGLDDSGSYGGCIKTGSSDKDRKSTRLNSSHTDISRMPSSA